MSKAPIIIQKPLNIALISDYFGHGKSFVGTALRDKLSGNFDNFRRTPFAGGVRERILEGAGLYGNLYDFLDDLVKPVLRFTNHPARKWVCENLPKVRNAATAAAWRTWNFKVVYGETKSPELRAMLQFVGNFHRQLDSRHWCRVASAKAERLIEEYSPSMLCLYDDLRYVEELEFLMFDALAQKSKLAVIAVESDFAPPAPPLAERDMSERSYRALQNIASEVSCEQAYRERNHNETIDVSFLAFQNTKNELVFKQNLDLISLDIRHKLLGLSWSN